VLAKANLIENNNPVTKLILSKVTILAVVEPAVEHTEYR
jgi:hypothetical protein